MRRWIVGLAFALLAGAASAQSPVCTATTDSVIAGSETTCTVTVHVACTPCPTPTPTPTPTPSVYDDAIALWKLDEESDGSGPVTRVDSIGSLDLTDNNTVPSAAKGVGAPANLPANVASFNGASSERLTHVDDALLKFGTEDFTFSVWINPTTFVGFTGVLDKGSQADYTLDNFGGAMRFYSSNGGGFPIASVVQPSTGVWSHIIVWRSSADSKWYIQLNGGTPGQASATIVSSDTTGGFTVGAIGAGAFFNGLVSSVALWDRALTADERAELYNSGDAAPLP